MIPIDFFTSRLRSVDVNKCISDAINANEELISDINTNVLKTGFDTENAWDRLLSFDNSQVYRAYHDKTRSGFSIRCIKDK